MTMFSSKTKKIAAAFVAAATLGVALAPTGASARGWRHHHHGYGYGAAIGGGLLLGALAATAYSTPAYARDCWLEKRKRYDRYGYPFYVKVRVCD